MKHSILTVACAVGAASSAPGQVGIESFAPRESYLVASTSDAAGLLAAMDRSALRTIWDHPKVQTWFKESTEEGFGEMREAMDELGVDIDSLSPPTGSVGFAYFFVDEIDEDGEAWPVQRTVACADFGDEAEAVLEAFWALADEWSENDEAIVNDEAYGDATIIEVEWTAASIPQPAEDADWEEWEKWYEDSVTPLSALSASSHLYVAFLGGHVLASDEEGMVERAVDALGGDDLDAVNDSKLYQNALAQHPDDIHASVVFLATEGMKDMMVQTMQYTMGMDMPGMDVTAVMEVLGLLEFQAAGVGLRLDGPDAPVEVSHGILMPEKEGLVSLFDTDPTPFTVPPFVSADAAEVMRLGIRFDEIFTVADRIIATFDEEQRAEINPMMDIARGMLAAAFNEIGPELYIITSYAKPLSMESQTALYALPVGDELIINNTLTILSSQMGGMIETRDFEGAVIYESQGFLEIAVGSGYGHLFIGDAVAVENALRQAANPGAASLGDEPRFRDATGALGDNMQLASYIDLAQRIEWMRWMFDNELEVIRTWLEEAEYPQELIEQELEDQRERLAERTPLPPYDVLLEVLGDVVTEVVSTPDGFRGRALILETD